jgi:hypothetical protein
MKADSICPKMPEHSCKELFENSVMLLKKE